MADPRGSVPCMCNCPYPEYRYLCPLHHPEASLEALDEVAEGVCLLIAARRASKGGLFGTRVRSHARNRKLRKPLTPATTE